MIPTFTSPRERRLWLLALAVVAAIYSTLGLAGVLAEKLPGVLLGVSFGAAFLMVLVAVVWNGLKRRPGRRETWAWLGIVAVYGMVLVRMGVTPLERTHLFEYGLVAALVHQALLERRRGGQPLRAPALVAVVATAVLGWIDEGIQAVLPGRVYDLRDVGVNALAGLMAVAATLILGWARRRDRMARLFRRRG